MQPWDDDSAVFYRSTSDDGRHRLGRDLATTERNGSSPRVDGEGTGRRGEGHLSGEGRADARQVDDAGDYLDENEAEEELSVGDKTITEEPAD
jgi:hypothetical protein